MIDNGKIFEKLLQLANDKGIIVRFAPLQGSYGRITGDRLAIKQELRIEEINYNLAHELAHAYLHYDIDVIESEQKEQYEQQADRAAQLLLCAVSVGINQNIAV